MLEITKEKYYCEDAEKNHKILNKGVASFIDFELSNIWHYYQLYEYTRRYDKNKITCHEIIKRCDNHLIKIVCYIDFNLVVVSVRALNGTLDNITQYVNSMTDYIFSCCEVALNEK